MSLAATLNVFAHRTEGQDWAAAEMVAGLIMPGQAAPAPNELELPEP